MNPMYPPGQGPNQGPYPQQTYQQQPGMPPPVYHPIQPQKKKPGIFKIGCGVLVGLVVLIAAISVATGGKSSTSTTPSSPGSSVSSAQAPARTWQTTHTYSGNGNQQTETFAVGNDWKIQWKCQGVDGMDAPLYVSIYNADTNEMADWSAVSTSCKSASSTTGETTEHGGGNLYLKIISGIDWTLTIQELK